MKKSLLFALCTLLPLAAAAQQNWKAVTRYDKQDAKTKLTEKLTDYVTYDTQAGTDTDKVPSSKGQTAFAKKLAKDLKRIGAQNVTVSKNGAVTADIPSTSANTLPTLLFAAPMDTTPALSGKDVKPQVHAKYNGGDIVINPQSNVRLTQYNSPQLMSARTHDLITASGGTVLGADAKAGAAVLLTYADYLLGNTSVAHGPVKLLFIPDTLNGRGTDALQPAGLGADYAFVLGAGNTGEYTSENFNVRYFTAVFEGDRTQDPGNAMYSDFADNLLMAADFHTLLPRQRRPETTAGNRGFIWVNDITHNGNTSTVKGEIHAFTDQELQELTDLVNQSFNTVKSLYPKRKSEKLTFTDGAKNLRPSLPPQMPAQLQEAMQKEEITPVPVPRRDPGGPAAALTAGGLPAIGLFNGSFNSGTELEYADADVMEAALRTLLTLTADWPAQSAG